ncbi:MAG: DUF4292 domain-containing protein [Bacteroidota bacterium]
MNKFAGIALLIVLSLSSSSCALLKRGKKKNKKAQTVALVTDTAAVVASPTAGSNTANVSPETKQLISDLTPLWKKRFSYTTFSGKAKMDYSGPQSSQDFTANFRIKKDSIIWIAISGLGGLVQVARIYITPDSIFIMDQLHKEATIMPLTEAAKILPAPVEFSSLQNLIVGDPLKDGEINNATSSDMEWAIDAADNNYQQHITYDKMDSTMKTAKLAARAGASNAMIAFGNYMNIRERKLSMARVVNLNDGKGSHTVEMNFTNADFDQPIDFPFSIPKNYSIKSK